MPIICVGISHHTAPVALRERLAFTATSIGAALDRLAGPACPPGVREAVVLATCNRTELYALVDEVGAGEQALTEFLITTAEPDGTPEAARGTPAGAPRGSEAAWGSLAAHLVTQAGEDAVGHLMRVAGGLDSMILGEAQILGQVQAAAAEARHRVASGPVLDALFTAAVRAGRRVRRETEIGTRAASVPSAAVALAREAGGGLGHSRIVVIGAGKMGVLTAQALAQSGTYSILVSNRSYERAVALAQEWGGCAVRFDKLEEVLAEADTVITSTSAPHPVLRRDQVAQILDRRAGRPLTIVDIAVPRDVEPAVGELPGVRLFDIDDLQAVVDENLAERAAAVPGAEAIVAEEAARFMGWLASLELAPTIAELRQWAEAIRATEVERTLRRLGRLDEREQELVRALSAAIVGKLLHPPIAYLRAHAHNGAAPLSAELVRTLFDLGDAPDLDLGNTPGLPTDSAREVER